jgi:hypothetical protein
MSDVTLEYGSTGFEKVQTEIEKLHDYTSKVPSWFQAANKPLEEHATHVSNAFGKINTAIQESSSHVLGFIGHIARLGAIVGTVQGVLGGLGVYAFERWTKSVLTATDSHRQLEQSLLGVVKSQGAVNKIVEFSEAYAAKSPMATRHEVLGSLREFAFIPSIQPIMEEGDTDMMERLMNVVQGLSKIRPEAGWAGATNALKLAMMRIWRTMGHEYAIRPEMLAGKAGMSMEEFESSPSKSFKALETHVLSVTQPTTNLTNVIKKLRESYQEWLEDLGKTGIYDTVLGYLTKLNEFFRRIGESEQWKGVTKGINTALEGIANGIANILTKGIDWEKVTDLSGALSAFRQVGANTIEEVSKAWEENKDVLNSTFEKIITFVANAAIGVAGKVFVPVGEAIGNAMIEGMKKHPLLATLIGFSVGGLKGAAIAGGGAFGLWLQEANIPANVASKRHQEALWEMEKVSFEAPEWKGLRPWARENVPIEKAGEWPSEGRYVGMYRAMGGYRAPLETKAGALEPPIGPTSQFGMLKNWYQMAGQLSEMEPGSGGLAKRPGFLFATNQIPAEEYFKRERMGGVQDKYLKELTAISEMPEATQIKPQIYQEMFGISVQRGETTKAGDLLQKTMDAMKEAVKGKAKTDGDIRDTATNTGEAVKLLREIAAKKEGKEGQPINKPGQAPEGHPVGAGAEQPWTEDELQTQVRKGLGVYEY